jgi:hypothetical protein
MTYERFVAPAARYRLRPESRRVRGVSDSARRQRSQTRWNPEASRALRRPVIRDNSLRVESGRTFASEGAVRMACAQPATRVSYQVQRLNG